MVSVEITVEATKCTLLSTSKSSATAVQKRKPMFIQQLQGFLKVCDRLSLWFDC